MPTRLLPTLSTVNNSDLRRLPIHSLFNRGSEPSNLPSQILRRFGWLGRLFAPPSRRPSPFSRLDLYKVGHGLTYRLRIYNGRDSVDMFRGVPWATLVYWALLMEGSVEDVAYAYALSE
jgi:hypothetical protein